MSTLKQGTLCLDLQRNLPCQISSLPEPARIQSRQSNVGQFRRAAPCENQKHCYYMCSRSRDFLRTHTLEADKTAAVWVTQALVALETVPAALAASVVLETVAAASVVLETVPSALGQLETGAA